MNDLTHRLRCRYPMGPIQPSGEPEFGWRDCGGPVPAGLVLPTPIMLEAAAEIERLRASLDNVTAFVTCTASAISYQSLGEYRTALLRILREAQTGTEGT